MENAIWNGKIYTATEIAESYQLETNIRKASNCKQLKCPDPDCSSPILRYRHGEKRTAHFAHLNNCTCDYAEFDKTNTSVLRQVKRALYDSLLEKGFSVQLEVKLLPRHYTHLLVTMEDGKKIAIELGTKNTTASRIEDLVEKYSAIGVEVKWVVVSNEKTTTKENETFYIKRYSLNERKKNDVLILNEEGTEVTQYIVDPNQYTYRGKIISSKNYPEKYKETKDLSALTFENGELTIAGFYDGYDKWLATKKRAFDKKIEELEKQRPVVQPYVPSRTIAPRTNRNMGIQRVPMNIPQEVQRSADSMRKTVKPTVECAKLVNACETEEIRSLIEQQEHPVIDKKGVRWVKCERCGKIDAEAKFGRYGGNGRVNLGLCNECEKSKHKEETT